jgi:predicted TIM-barrel fold metal-dependent hydrolase
MFKIIDVHTHYYPRSYVKVLEKYGFLKIVDCENILLQWSKSRKTITRILLIDIEKRLKYMQKFNFNLIQVLSIAPPFTYFLRENDEIEVVKKINNEIFEIINKFPEYFKGFAALPLNVNDINSSIEEAERAIKDLGLNGYVIGTGINNRIIDDEKYKPLLEFISKSRRPIFIHPGTIKLDEIIDESNRITNLLSFPFETSYIALRLILSGLLDILDLKLILPHGGGFLPYQFSRFDKDYDINKELKEKIKMKPSHYLRRMYYDSVIYNGVTLKYLINVVGISQILFGSDFPFMGREPAEIKALIENCGLSEEELYKIFYKNFEYLLNN